MYRGVPDDYVAAGVSYLAYSGPYYVDEARRTVEHEMAVSLFPNWKGQRQLRIPELDGDTLWGLPKWHRCSVTSKLIPTWVSIGTIKLHSQTK